MPSFNVYVNEYSNSLKFAVYSLFPVDPVGITTDVDLSVMFVPDHPINSYPGLVGFTSVIELDSILYSTGLFNKANSSLVNPW